MNGPRKATIGQRFAFCQNALGPSEAKVSSFAYIVAATDAEGRITAYRHTKAGKIYISRPRSYILL